MISKVIPGTLLFIGVCVFVLSIILNQKQSMAQFMMFSGLVLMGVSILVRAVIERKESKLREK